jgi:hypothetical protein
MRTIGLTILALSLALTAGTLPAPAEEHDKDTPDWVMDTSGIGQSHNGTVRSDQILELGTASASCLQLEGENSLRMGNIDNALLALQKAVEMAPMDMDKRTLYAQALEKKLFKQKVKDPVLYNFLIKQWLFIFRKAEFIDQTMEGRSHLLHLCGAAPKAFEKSEKYLARVLVPEDGNSKVAGKKAAMPE